MITEYLWVDVLILVTIILFISIATHKNNNQE
mgnify:CR=1 FL=1|jgi:hypothetical protein